MEKQDKRQCPNCQKQMVFTPDGRELICEICNYRQNIERKRRTPAQMAAEQTFTIMASEDPASFRANVRDLLGQGIAAIKAGNMDEAHFYLELVLRKQASEKEQAQAWLWMSEVYDDLAHKRECLEQVLIIEPTNAVARRGMAIVDGRLRQDEIVDPNQLKPQASETPQDAQAEQFRCPQCSARMNYTPDGQALLCEFCSYRQELNGDGDQSQGGGQQYGIGAMEQDFIAALATARGHLQPISMRWLQCQGCAVEFVLPPETLTLTCPYCGSVYVTETAETREIMPPQALIPFATTEDDAKMALRDWFKKHKMNRVGLSPVIGIYLPVWTFDMGGDIPWSGRERRGDDWLPVSGNHYLLYDDFLVPGSNKLPPRLAKGFEDFDLSQLVAYDARYLADWPAERYQIALADASLIARKNMLKQLRRDSVRLTNGRFVNDLRISSRNLIIESFKLILLPMWVAHYKYENKVYDVVVNGQTNEVRGQKEESIVGQLFSWLRGD